MSFVDGVSSCPLWMQVLFGPGWTGLGESEVKQ